MTLFKNDDTLEIIYKLFQACSYFFHQNKAKITSTITSDTDKVPSCAAVSTALSGKLNSSSKASGINDDNKNDDDSVPSVKAVAAYVDSNISGALDITVTKGEVAEDVNNTTLSIENTTEGICIVRVTNLSDGSIQYKSNIKLDRLVNTTRAFTFPSMPKSAKYMVEAWSCNSDTKKLIPTAVKFI